MIPGMLRSAILGLVVLGASAGLTSVKAEYSEAEIAGLAASLKDVKLALEAGLTASEREGKPISAKFELDEGKLQLSVYTTQPDAFMEVVVDPKTGAIAKAEKLADAEDLAAAEAQKAAMAKATISLLAATERVVKANSGYRAVSVTPKIVDGHPLAQVTLVQGAAFKSVTEKLD